VDEAGRWAAEGAEGAEAAEGAAEAISPVPDLGVIVSAPSVDTVFPTRLECAALTRPVQNATSR
jgi:hypothetical protein